MDLTAHVPKDIIDLLSSFLPNRRADVRRLRAALELDNWDELRHLAERMYAVGNPYGFRQITTFGRFMREACAANDVEKMKRLIDDYALYLANVKVVEVEEPVARRVFSKPSPPQAIPADIAEADARSGSKRRPRASASGEGATRKPGHGG